VNVLAGGLRMNLAVWVCHYISMEFKVHAVNVHYTDDDRTHTVFSFKVLNEDPIVAAPVNFDDTLVIKIAKHSSIRSLRTVLYNVDDVHIIAAGALCYKALFLTTFALKYRFSLQKIDVIWTGDRVGIKIKLYKPPDTTYKCPSEQDNVAGAVEDLHDSSD